MSLNNKLLKNFLTTASAMTIVLATSMEASAVNYTIPSDPGTTSDFTKFADGTNNPADLAALSNADSIVMGANGVRLIHDTAGTLTVKRFDRNGMTGTMALLKNTGGIVARSMILEDITSGAPTKDVAVGFFEAGNHADDTISITATDVANLLTLDWKNNNNTISIVPGNGNTVDFTGVTMQSTGGNNGTVEVGAGTTTLGTFSTTADTKLKDLVIYSGTAAAVAQTSGNIVLVEDITIKGDGNGFDPGTLEVQAGHNITARNILGGTASGNSEGILKFAGASEVSTSGGAIGNASGTKLAFIEIGNGEVKFNDATDIAADNIEFSNQAGGLTIGAQNATVTGPIDGNADGYGHLVIDNIDVTIAGKIGDANPIAYLETKASRSVTLSDTAKFEGTGITLGANSTVSVAAGKNLLFTGINSGIDGDGTLDFAGASTVTAKSIGTMTPAKEIKVNNGEVDIQTAGMVKALTVSLNDANSKIKFSGANFEVTGDVTNATGTNKKGIVEISETGKITGDVGASGASIEGIKLTADKILSFGGGTVYAGHVSTATINQGTIKVLADTTFNNGVGYLATDEDGNGTPSSTTAKALKEIEIGDGASGATFTVNGHVNAPVELTHTASKIKVLGGGIAANTPNTPERKVFKAIDSSTDGTGEILVGDNTTSGHVKFEGVIGGVKKVKSLTIADNSSAYTTANANFDGAASGGGGINLGLNSTFTQQSGDLTFANGASINGPGVLSLASGKELPVDGIGTVTKLKAVRLGGYTQGGAPKALTRTFKADTVDLTGGSKLVVDANFSNSTGATGVGKVDITSSDSSADSMVQLNATSGTTIDGGNLGVPVKIAGTGKFKVVSATPDSLTTNKVAVNFSADGILEVTGGGKFDTITAATAGIGTLDLKNGKYTFTENIGAAGTSPKKLQMTDTKMSLTKAITVHVPSELTNTEVVVGTHKLTVGAGASVTLAGDITLAITYNAGAGQFDASQASMLDMSAVTSMCFNMTTSGTPSQGINFVPMLLTADPMNTTKPPLNVQPTVIGDTNWKFAGGRLFYGEIPSGSAPKPQQPQFPVQGQGGPNMPPPPVFQQGGPNGGGSFALQGTVQFGPGGTAAPLNSNSPTPPQNGATATMQGTNIVFKTAAGAGFNVSGPQGPANPGQFIPGPAFPQGPANPNAAGTSGLVLGPPVDMTISTKGFTEFKPGQPGSFQPQANVVPFNAPQLATGFQGFVDAAGQTAIQNNMKQEFQHVMPPEFFDPAKRNLTAAEILANQAMGNFNKTNVMQTVTVFAPPEVRGSQTFEKLVNQVAPPEMQKLAMAAAAAGPEAMKKFMEANDPNRAAHNAAFAATAARMGATTFQPVPGPMVPPPPAGGFTGGNFGISPPPAGGPVGAVPLPSAAPGINPPQGGPNFGPAGGPAGAVPLPSAAPGVNPPQGGPASGGFAPAGSPPPQGGPTDRGTGFTPGGEKPMGSTGGFAPEAAPKGGFDKQPGGGGQPVPGEKPMGGTTDFVGEKPAGGAGNFDKQPTGESTDRGTGRGVDTKAPEGESRAGGRGVDTDINGLTSDQIRDIDENQANSSLFEGIAAGSDVAFHEKFGVWGSVTVGQAKQKLHKDNPGFKSVSRGFSVGVDTLVNERLTIGMSGAYNLSNTKHKDSKEGDKTESDSWSVSVYANYQLSNNWFIRGSGVYTSTNIKSIDERPVGPAIGYAIASYSMKAYGGDVTVGFTHMLPENFVLTPTAGFRVMHTPSMGYTETGNSGQNNTITQNASNSYSALLGLSVAKSFVSGGLNITPEAHANLQYGVGIKTPKGTFLSQMAPNDLIRFAGDKPSRLSSSAGLGVTIGSERLEVGATADMDMGKKYRGYRGSLKVTLKF